MQAGEALQRLVVELARPARPLGLGGLEALAGRALAGLLQRSLHAHALAQVREHHHRPARPGTGALR